jgi:WD40 repeat protein
MQTKWKHCRPTAVVLGLALLGLVSLEAPGGPKGRRPATSGGGRVVPVYAAAFSPDGKTRAAGRFDRTIRLWDVATGKERLTGG